MNKKAWKKKKASIKRYQHSKEIIININKKDESEKKFFPLEECNLPNNNQVNTFLIN